MKKLVLLVIAALMLSVASAQSSFHNYFSQTTGSYIQVGFGNGYLLFKDLSVHTQFVRMNYISSKGGMKYYGNNRLQVVVKGGSVCVCTAQSANWYNYCGPVPIPSPYVQGTSGGSAVRASGKCPWCNGKGRITKNDAVPQYGMNDCDVYVKCNECGTTYNSSYRNHYHLDCGKCGGTGRMR